MSNQEENKEKRDPFDGDYIGNIWGWKFSFIGLGMIVFFGAIILYREMTVGEEFRQRQQQEQLMQPDSTNNIEADTLK